MKILNYALVRFSVFLTAGILVAHFYDFQFSLGFPLLFMLFLIIVLWFFANRNFIQKVYFGIAVYICFFLIGCTIYQLRRPNFQNNHYSHIVLNEKSQLVHLKIIEKLKPDLYNDKYYAAVLSIDSNNTKGKILLSISRDSMPKIFSPDEILLVYTSFYKIEKALNPHQFDFAGYMENQEIYHQIQANYSSILYSNKGKKTVFGIAQNFRQNLIKHLSATSISKDERSIIQALILGDKKEIDKQLYQEYAAAGAVHILAVSGLHVGILFVILNFLFRPLQNFKYGKILQSMLIVILLWSFAFIAGLSPSVVRSVSMFTFFAIALLLGRRTNGLNTLFLSYFFLLLINPLWLFQVGFQLSYAAVFFILWTQPIFNRLSYSKYYLVRETKGLITVSLSAQIGVLPLSLFYFNQFPGLFLVTNLVVLPVLTLFMIGGVFIVTLASIEALPDWLARIYNLMIEKLNAFISWISQQEAFIFSDVFFSKLTAIASYILIISIILWFRKSNYTRLISVLMCFIVFLSILSFDKTTTSNSELWIFHKNRTSLIGYKNMRHLTLMSKEQNQLSEDEFPVKTYKVKSNIRFIEHQNLPEVFKYNDQTILVLDSLGTIPKRNKIDILVLTNSPKINLRRIIDSLKPKQIIADGSNYPSFVEQWKTQSENTISSFHYTGEDGAFLLQ